LNRKGFTLVEVLIAGALLVMALSGFSYLLKSSINYVRKAKTDAQTLYQARGEMERIRALPFDQLAAAGSAGTTITQIAADLYLIKVGKLYTLRSKYE
jgi:Tfp pilus assembly protein PilV